MKINLLPTSIAKEGQSKTFLFLGAIIAIGAIILSVLMITSSQSALAKAKDEAETHRLPAANAYATAKYAEDVMATSTVIDRNLKLSEAMAKHNSAYIDLYRDLMKYIPSYYRVTSLSAVSGGADSSTITIVGELKTFQQYADLSLALWRIPDVISVGRAGYTPVDPSVPGLSQADQKGAAIKPGDTPLPSDALEKMDALIARASAAPSGYQSVGGFGDDATKTKGAMPEWSTVTMSVVIKRDIQTPDPRATILSQGAGAASGAPAAGTGGFNQVSNPRGGNDLSGVPAGGAPSGGSPKGRGNKAGDGGD